jgi:hypothetical protein
LKRIKYRFEIVSILTRAFKRDFWLLMIVTPASQDRSNFTENTILIRHTSSLVESRTKQASSGGGEKAISKIIHSDKYGNL